MKRLISSIVAAIIITTPAVFAQFTNSWSTVGLEQLQVDEDITIGMLELCDLKLRFTSLLQTDYPVEFVLDVASKRRHPSFAGGMLVLASGSLTQYEFEHAYATVGSPSFDQGEGGFKIEVRFTEDITSLAFKSLSGGPQNNWSTFVTDLENFKLMYRCG